MILVDQNVGSHVTLAMPFSEKNEIHICAGANQVFAFGTASGITKAHLVVTVLSFFDPHHCNRP